MRQNLTTMSKIRLLMIDCSKVLQKKKKTSISSLLPHTHAQRFLFLLKTTGLWAAGGISFMVADISTTSDTGFMFVPMALVVPHSFNPDNDFLQIGMIVFGVGLVKLVAYQAWSGMRQRGNTIDGLSLNIGVINGSAYNAVKLLFLKPGNRFLGAFFSCTFRHCHHYLTCCRLLYIHIEEHKEHDYLMNVTISRILHVPTVSETGIDFSMGVAYTASIQLCFSI